MNPIRKGPKLTHRGISGVESAIVLIAFVIVGAALAFVVLNMGSSTTQEAKTTIISGISGASTTLEVAGTIVGFADFPNNLNATVTPIRIIASGDSVDLDDSRISVKYSGNAAQYDDILDDCTLTASTYASASLAFDAAELDGACQLDSNPITSDAPALTTAVIFWTVRDGSDPMLDVGEHANLAIAWSISDQPSTLDTIRAEIVLQTGSTLTLERQVPMLTNTVVNLG